MSFEGYDRVLCENGHLFECDVYAIHETDLNNPDWKCRRINYIIKRNKHEKFSND